MMLLIANAHRLFLYSYNNWLIHLGYVDKIFMYIYVYIYIYISIFKTLLLHITNLYYIMRHFTTTSTTQHIHHIQYAPLHQQYTTHPHTICTTSPTIHHSPTHNMHHFANKHHFTNNTPLTHYIKHHFTNNAPLHQHPSWGLLVENTQRGVYANASIYISQFDVDRIYIEGARNVFLDNRKKQENDCQNVPFPQWL